MSTPGVAWRWRGEARWQRAYGSTEREAALHLASLASSSCPVPGAYRAGTRRVTQLSESLWLLPTGAAIETRAAKIAQPFEDA